MAKQPTKPEVLAELAKRELARRHLLNFIRYRFNQYRVNWHHKVLAEKLELVKEGKLKKLMVFMPPRHGKSELVSVNFPAWVYGSNPDLNIIAASYSSDLATDFGRQVRNIMLTPQYAVLFDTRLAEDAKAKGSWSTNGRGNYNAVGVGGSSTGKGADIMIIDDPVKDAQEADSEVVSEAVWDWYKSVAVTRLSPEGARIIVMTRWNDKDLAGRILEQDSDWDIVEFPAICEVTDDYRKEGEALWADYFTLPRLLEIKKDVGSMVWASLYQQNPIVSENATFTRSMFRYISFEEVLKKQTLCYITIDSAGSNKEKKSSDWTGVTINWVDRDNVWYIKSYHEKVSGTGLIDLIFQLHNTYKPEAIGLEKTMYTEGIQPYLTVEMAKRNCYPYIKELKHGGTAKELRIRSLVPRYERGHIVHIIGMCDDLENELVRFPKARNDDTSDSLAYQSHIASAPYALSDDDMDLDDDLLLFPDIGL